MHTYLNEYTRSKIIPGHAQPGKLRKRTP